MGRLFRREWDGILKSEGGGHLSQARSEIEELEFLVRIALELPLREEEAGEEEKGVLFEERVGSNPEKGKEMAEAN